MALEDIFRALEEQADKDSEAVLVEARAHAAAIVEEAELAASKSREAHIEAAGKAVRSRNAQDLNSVRLDARKQMAGVKERAVNDVFEAALAELAAVRARPDYPQSFRNLADEALSGVEGDFDVLVDPADADLARAVLAERGVDATVRPDLSTTGGLVIALEGGRIMRRNTLEDRLEKLAGRAQAEVAEILFT